MSDLLNSASLVMIPSGYKEDTVFSQIPTDGSGDMAFTRASNGTRVNSAGLVEVTPWNIVQESETFTNAIWNLYYATVTSNSQTAPNGTLTADTLNSTTQQYSGIYQQLGTLPTNVYTYSIYVKAGTNTFFGMLGQGSGSQIAIFNLSTGVVSSISNLDSASIENVGNGWYRCQIQKTGAGVEMLIFSSNIANSIPTASGTVFIWGAQVNIGSTAKPYFPTTDRLNVPRLTYQNGGGGCPSLLLEKQSTNLVTYSEQFDNAGWTKYQGGTITANSVTSPDGTQNADTLTVASGQTYSGIYQSVSASSDVYTVSIFAKYNTKRWLFFFDASASAQGWFDIQNGVLGTIPSGHTGTIENFGNGWYRLTFKKNTAVIPSFFQIGLVDADGSSTPSSNGSSYIWGAQLEASSYPTSYIPTTSSSVTRVADACSKTGISSLIGQTQGVLFVDLVITGTTGNNRFSISDGSNTNWIFIGTPEDGSNGGSRFYIKTNGSVHVDVGAASYFTIGQRYKLAIAYKSGDWAVYGNGVQLYSGTDSIASVSSPLSVFNFFNATGGNADCGEQVNETILFTTRLSNSELASLTSL